MRFLQHIKFMNEKEYIKINLFWLHVIYIYIYIHMIFKRPGVAGAVLQSPTLLR